MRFDLARSVIAGTGSGLRSTVRRRAASGTLVLGLTLTLLTGCSFLDKQTASTSTTPAPKPVAAQPTANAVATSVNPTDLAIMLSSAGQPLVEGIPIPIPSPRERSIASAPGVQVASIDPSAGLTSSLLRPAITGNAQNYALYFKNVDLAGAAPLKTPKQVRGALATMRYSDAHALAVGWYSYQGHIAAQDPVFRKGVQDTAARLGKDEFLASLTNNVNYAMNLPGAANAQKAVMASIAQDDRRMSAVASKFSEATRVMGTSKWGMMTPLPPEFTATPPVQEAAATNWLDKLKAGLRAGMTELAPVTPAEAAAHMVMERILIVGARDVVLGKVGGDTPPLYASDPDTVQCLTWARLNLSQCLAAAHYPSEEAYCTGKHAVEEVRSCLSAGFPAGAVQAAYK
ncbi:MAG: hypothetical protein PW790_09220 [Parvibaculaceae bacterium]|nr:hypothetical protein [Parvibaculaceae bacterium]